MRVVLFPGLLAFGLSVLSTNAVAQNAPSRQAEQPRDRAPAKTVFNFDADEVEGTLRRPDGVTVVSTPKTSQPSLIELRKDFVPELLKSMDDV